MIVDPLVVKANSDFACDLLRDLSRAALRENIAVSPISISMAFSLVYSGASGKAKAELEQALNYARFTRDEIDQANMALLTNVERAETYVNTTIANSLWAQRDFPLQKTFVDCGARFYNATLDSVDLQDPAAISRMNQWAAKHTRGMIQEAIDHIDPGEVLVLVNTACLDAIWTHQFDVSDTKPSIFHLMGGRDVLVPMMNMSRSYRYDQTADFEGIRLPYGNGRISMYVFLPSPKITIAEFCCNLTAAKLQNWISEFQDVDVELALPKFKIGYSCDLRNPLTGMGVISLFTPEADLTGISSVRPMWISRAEHRAVIEVNEKGTRAAAATTVAATLSMHLDSGRMKVDRPFFFVIRDDKTDALLFMGVIVDPR